MNSKPQIPKTSSDYMTSSEAAAELYVSTETLRRYEERGLVKSIRTSGGHRRFEREKIISLKEMGTELGQNHVLKDNQSDLSDQILFRQKKALNDVFDLAKIEHPDDNFILVKKITNSDNQYSDWLAVPLTVDGAKTGQIIGFLVASSAVTPKVWFVVGDKNGESLREDYLSFVQSNHKPIKSRKDFHKSFNNAKQSLASEWTLNALAVSTILMTQAGFAIALILSGSSSNLFKALFVGGVVLAIGGLVAFAISFAFSENFLRNVTARHVFQVSTQKLPISTQDNKTGMIEDFKEHIQAIKNSSRIGENSRKSNDV